MPMCRAIQCSLTYATSLRSVFPSSYRSDAEQTTTKVEVEAKTSGAGREGHDTRYSSVSANLGRRRNDRSDEEEDVTYEEEDRDQRRPRRREEISIHAEGDRYHRDKRDHVDVEVEFSSNRHHHRDRDSRDRYQEVDIEFDRRRGDHQVDADIDVTEREYRHRTRPGTDDEFVVRDYSTAPRDTRIEVERETVFDRSDDHDKHNMGYYDDDGHHHSFRRGIEKATDRFFHPRHPRSTVREDIYIEDDDDRHHHHHHHSRPVRSSREEIRYTERGRPSHTVVIPCHYIRIGDLLILQGRPCEVIRITTSSQTGQHRYLGVDLFTKQLHEESSFISNPAPSVVTQNMLGPIYKQYRVLDIRDDGRVVAMTETGDVKQGLPVIDQGSLWSRLNDAYADGRGSVRVLVINDGTRELAVDYKVVHGSKL
ncbi:MAG: hypothetical protein M1825_002029 [Sarcosagium campestre]|nr:MAG: hypothetical protein M1825_002029 [Sarcosagium campestre]